MARTKVGIARAALEKTEANLVIARNNRTAAASEIVSAEAKAEQTAQHLERSRNLAARSSIAQAVADDAGSEHKTATAMLRAARAERAARDSAVLVAKADLKMAMANLRDAEAEVKKQAAGRA